MVASANDFAAERVYAEDLSEKAMYKCTSVGIICTMDITKLLVRHCGASVSVV